MASNEYVIPEHYEDLTPAPQLDQKTLNKMAWRSCFLQASFNYERMQAAGWLYSIIPGLEKIHTNKNDLAASMSHNLEFFNTHPFLVTFVMGIVLSLEQNKVDIPTIRAVRVAAMGPLGGIGDALFWLTLVPITAGITSNMAINGNAAAPIIFLVIFNAVQFALRFWLMNACRFHHGRLRRRLPGRHHGWHPDQPPDPQRHHPWPCPYYRDRLREGGRELHRYGGHRYRDR